MKRLDPTSPFEMIRGDWAFLDDEDVKKVEEDFDVLAEADVAAGRNPVAGRVLRDAMAFLKKGELVPSRHFPDMMSDYILDVGTDDLWSATANGGGTGGEGVGNTCEATTTETTESTQKKSSHIPPLSDPYMVGHLLRYLFNRLPPAYGRQFGFVADYLIDHYTWDPNGGAGLANIRKRLGSVAVGSSEELVLET